MRRELSQDENPVFASKKGKPLSHRNVTRRGFEPAAAKTGIEGVSIHDARHAFASRLIDRGISATELAKLMGHETSAVTERVYVHRFDRQRTDDLVRGDDPMSNDNIIKIPFRGAAPAKAARLIAAATPPPGSWFLEIPFTDADVIPDADQDDFAKEGNGED